MNIEYILLVFGTVLHRVFCCFQLPDITGVRLGLWNGDVSICAPKRIHIGDNINNVTVILNIVRPPQHDKGYTTAHPPTEAGATSTPDQKTVPPLTWNISKRSVGTKDGSFLSVVCGEEIIKKEVGQDSLTIHLQCLGRNENDNGMSIDPMELSCVRGCNSNKRNEDSSACQSHLRRKKNSTSRLMPLKLKDTLHSLFQKITETKL